MLKKSLLNRSCFIRKTNRKITGGQIVYNKLLENNVEDAFIYSGGAIMPLIDCFYNGKINYYVNSHEQNTGHAATGYAKSSNKTGVCIVTSGPGLTNMVTPILDATNDSTPLVVLSGQVPLNSVGTNAFQECPATDITKGITKWSYQAKNIQELPNIIDKAFQIANDGKKGSVHIDLPKCILGGEYMNNNVNKKDTLQKTLNVKTKDIIQSEKYNIYKISEMINKSKKPILYVGKGCNDYKDLLYKLSIKGNIPVTTTIHAMGVYDENIPLSLEFLGMHGNVAANYAIQASDCIIALGSRFDDRTTGNLKYYAPEAKQASKENRGGIIHIDIDKNQINKVVNSDLYYNGDAGEFLTKIIPYIRYNNNNNWIKQINNWKQKYPFNFNKLKYKIKTQDVITELNRQLYSSNLIDKTIITTGVGNHQMMACQFIKWKHPKTLITSGSLGVMGTGLPYAIGSQLANPDKIILDIDGDGSFNHTMSDLKTVVEYNLPVKIAIMNDGHQSMVRTWEQLFYNNRITATELKKNPDYEKLANSFGIKSLAVDNHNDLSNIVDKFLKYTGPILCNFKVETDKCYPLVSPGKALNDLLLSDDSNYINKITGLPPS